MSHGRPQAVVIKMQQPRAKCNSNNKEKRESTGFSCTSRVVNKSQIGSFSLGSSLQRPRGWSSAQTQRGHTPGEVQLSLRLWPPGMCSGCTGFINNRQTQKAVLFQAGPLLRGTLSALLLTTSVLRGQLAPTGA